MYEPPLKELFIKKGWELAQEAVNYADKFRTVIEMVKAIEPELDVSDLENLDITIKSWFVRLCLACYFLKFKRLRGVELDHVKTALAKLRRLDWEAVKVVEDFLNKYTPKLVETTQKADADFLTGEPAVYLYVSLVDSLREVIDAWLSEVDPLGKGRLEAYLKQVPAEPGTHESRLAELKIAAVPSWPCGTIDELSAKILAETWPDLFKIRLVIENANKVADMVLPHVGIDEIRTCGREIRIRLSLDKLLEVVGKNIVDKLRELRTTLDQLDTILTKLKNLLTQNTH